MTVLEDLRALRDRHPEARRHERIVLDLALSLLETIEEEETGITPAQVTRMTSEDYLDLPDRFEMIDGRIRPKEWGYWEELYNRHRGQR